MNATNGCKHSSTCHTHSHAAAKTEANHTNASSALCLHERNDLLKQLTIDLFWCRPFKAGLATSRSAKEIWHTHQKSSICQEVTIVLCVCRCKSVNVVNQNYGTCARADDVYIHVPM